MKPLDILKGLHHPMQQVLLPARADRAIAYMDNCIGYVMRPHVSASNPALGAVRMPVVFGFWVILALVFASLVWGVLIPIESAAEARGSVVLYSSKKTIQHLEGGIIDEILVKEGDKVTEGQKLIRMRDTAPDAARDALQQQLYTERANVLRLTNEHDKRDTITFDADMVEKSSSDKSLADIIANQQHLFESERAEQESKVGELKQRVAQSREEIKGLQAESMGTTSQLDLLEKEIATVEKLLEKGYATETRLMALKRSQSELSGHKGQYEAQIAKTEQAITETELAIVNQQNEFDTKTVQNLHDSQTKVVELQDKLRSANDVAGRTVITAPTEGIVTGLRFHTSGGVISPGSPVMDIIPQNDDLIIEARIKPSDISVIHPDMDARVIFTSYKMRTTPRIPGKVTQVSADVFTDEHTSPPSSYYTARIQVDKDFLRSLTKPVELRPGMPVDIMIRTGSRSFVGYLLKPISDSMHGAFREQ